MSLGWIMLVLVGWILLTLVALTLVRMSGDQYRDARRAQKDLAFSERGSSSNADGIDTGCRFDLQHWSEFGPCVSSTP